MVDAANSFLESGRGKLSIACTHPDIGNDEITIGPLRDGRMLVEIAVPANAMLGDFDLVAGIYDWARATGGRGPSLEWQTRLEIVQEIRAWSPQRWLNELEPGLRTWIEIIGGALGIAVAAATFYFLLWPRPDACVRQLVGQLGPPIVDRGVTYGEYLKRIGEPPGNADPKTLKRVGNILDFRITVVGYRGKRLPVRWSTLTEGGRPLNAPQLTNQLAFEVEPDDCSDSGRRLTWTPLPQRAGSYINEINLIDDNGERLDTRRTAPFDIPLP